MRQEYDRFIAVATRVVGLIRGGHVAEAREAQLKEARPLADRLERLTNELVNKAEADVVADIEATGAAYRTSQMIVVAFAVGAIALALVLGRTISRSLIGPIREIDARLHEIASGDFSRRVKVGNRDELGALAANINRTSEQLGRLYRELEEVSQHKSAFLADIKVTNCDPAQRGPRLCRIAGRRHLRRIAERPKGVLDTSRTTAGTFWR